MDTQVTQLLITGKTSVVFYLMINHLQAGGGGQIYPPEIGIVISLKLNVVFLANHAVILIFSVV